MKNLKTLAVFTLSWTDLCPLLMVHDFWYIPTSTWKENQEFGYLKTGERPGYQQQLRQKSQISIEEIFCCKVIYELRAGDYIPPFSPSTFLLPLLPSFSLHSSHLCSMETALITNWPMTKNSDEIKMLFRFFCLTKHKMLPLSWGNL